jgi:hypothetical protein
MVKNLEEFNEKFIIFMPCYRVKNYKSNMMVSSTVKRPALVGIERRKTKLFKMMALSSGHGMDKIRERAGVILQNKCHLLGRIFLPKEAA